MDAVRILADVGIQLRQWRRGQHYMACPRCSTRKGDQHLSVLVTGQGHALWKCWRCGDFSGSTEAIGRKLEREARRREGPGANGRSPGMSPMKASSGPPAPPAVKPVPPAEGHGPAEHVPFGARHQSFWDALEPIAAGCPVGRYLAGRGCPLPLDGDLRWHPDFGYTRPGSSWKGPCMIGLVTDALTAEPMSFHFTWVRDDGAGKAPLERPRLLARGMAKQGGVIRLCDDADLGDWLMVGEGIETMLGARVLFGQRQAWSCIDAGNLARMPVPDWLRTIRIVADHDKVNPRTGKRAGIQAADELADRCERSGTIHDIEVYCPATEGWDANQALMARRRQEHVA